MKIVIDVGCALVNCARCGETHELPIIFKPLTHPVRDLRGREFASHWAECPTNGEPILMRLVEAKVS